MTMGTKTTIQIYKQQCNTFKNTTTDQQTHRQIDIAIYKAAFAAKNMWICKLCHIVNNFFQFKDKATSNLRELVSIQIYPERQQLNYR